MARQVLNKEILKQFQGKQVKIVFSDINHPQIIKGMLITIGEDFILVKGDYSQQAIPIKTILKISHILQGGSQ